MTVALAQVRRWSASGLTLWRSWGSTRGAAARRPRAALVRARPPDTWRGLAADAARTEHGRLRSTVERLAAEVSAVRAGVVAAADAVGRAVRRPRRGAGPGRRERVRDRGGRRRRRCRRWCRRGMPPTCPAAGGRRRAVRRAGRDRGPGRAGAARGRGARHGARRAAAAVAADAAGPGPSPSVVAAAAIGVPAPPGGSVADAPRTAPAGGPRCRRPRGSGSSPSTPSGSATATASRRPPGTRRTGASSTSGPRRLDADLGAVQARYDALTAAGPGADGAGVARGAQRPARPARGAAPAAGGGRCRRSRGGRCRPHAPAARPRPRPSSRRGRHRRRRHRGTRRRAHSRVRQHRRAATCPASSRRRAPCATGPPPPWAAPVAAASRWPRWRGWATTCRAGRSNVSTPDAARRGGADLARFYDGIDAARRADPHLTALGHSYGSLTTGYALQQAHGVDDAVLFGSPGIGTDDLGDVHVPAGHTGVVEAPWDPVADLGWFGDDPNRLDGVTGLSARAATLPDGAATAGSVLHAQYLTPGTTSQYNIAATVAGLPGRAHPRPGGRGGRRAARRGRPAARAMIADGDTACAGGLRSPSRRSRAGRGRVRPRRRGAPAGSPRAPA